ncbi:MAG: hypothetical protein WAT66_04795 [Actinomycetota bacterium]
MRAQRGAASSLLALRFFDTLDERGVRYCVWRGTLHLERGLRGEGDLDVFVPGSRRDDFFAIADELGFKRLSGARVEQLFGLDPENASLIHLDVYDRILVGPGEDRVLEVGDWIFDGARTIEGVTVPSVETELVLLCIRVQLALGTRGVARAALGRSPVVPERRVREIRSLLIGADRARIRERAVSSSLAINPDDLLHFLAEIERGTPRVLSAARGARRVQQQLPPAQRTQHQPAQKKRFARGLYVAVVGADGAGKSTLVHDLKRWLGKFDVHHLYFGIPKRSARIWSLRKARGAARRIKDQGAAWRFFNSALWLHIARRRLAAHREAERAVAAGGILIAERFPLPELWDMDHPMDGPRLKPTDHGYRREHEIYAAVGRPQLILVLSADLATLRGRQANLREEDHAQKARVVSSMRAGPNVCVIDATASYDDVLREAKREIWRRL